MDNFAYSNLIKAGGITMSSQKSEEKKLHKEKLFKDIVPRSRVQLDIVKRVRKAIENLPAELPAKIISYQDVIRENGEYYLLYRGSENLQPLAEYLNKNSANSQKIIKEFKETLELLKDVELISKLFPVGINAANFWIDDQQNVYLMPEEMLRSKRNYKEFELEIPAAEYFMPPEVIAGEEWQLKSYIFNTAAVFYYFLSGETIFSDQDNAKVLNKIQNEKILNIKALVPELSDSLNGLIMKMLAKEQSERPDLNFAVGELKENTGENDFKLDSFLERESIIDSKIIKKKRRNENVKLFFRQSWKVILFFAIIGGGFIWGLSSGSPTTITPDHTAREVVNYFYEGIATKNINLANEAVTFDLGEMERMISETHVIEKMQQAYGGGLEQGEEINKVYSLEKLKIEEISVSDDKYRFRATYEFNYRSRESQYSNQIVDQLVVEKVEGVWRITAIEGDFKKMINGEYPWREE
ncbi:protein kinase-like protein [Halanaerobium saccharolyticum]|uniref:Protein kinase-like protein n=2 Tax=Halanaerobium saccharolyticum TaxID=43595 RepID=A0A4R6M1I8_9FIRM|nr:protein kinase-like protein [Halanaerobium saccharolyticum]